MRSLSTIWVVLLMVNVAPYASGQIDVVRHDDRVEVTASGEPFAVYLIKSGRKPVIWPLIGPTGKEMTRAYPMRNDPSEEQDHIHQRSFWLTHGDVSGVSFWEESEHAGSVVHREFVDLHGGERGVIQTINDWIGPDGSRLLEETQSLEFAADEHSRWIDVDSMLTAIQEQVTLGDTKEGTFGVRVTSSMRVESGLGGEIVNSEGERDDAAWGKRAKWVDYHGPVQGETLGIAILNHPTSFRYPTYWHVRGYGLFAANPFGLRDFHGSDDFDGRHALQRGESIALRYRVLLHAGDEKQGKVEEIFAAYAKKALPVR